MLLDPPVGPTVDDLVAAWANLPDFVSTAAVDVTVDGYAGKQIEFTVPDYNADECKKKLPFGGLFALYDIPGIPIEDAPATWAQGPNQHLQYWIVDVDGTRLVISAYFFPYTSLRGRAALDEILASIQSSWPSVTEHRAYLFLWLDLTRRGDRRNIDALSPKHRTHAHVRTHSAGGTAHMNHQ